MSYFVGLDWASQEHTVCVIDAQARVIWRATIPHTAEGMIALRTKLTKLAAPSTLPVAVERPSGLLVDTLTEAGFPVVPIHPNVLKASRPRYSAAQGKSDLGDAFILADLLRTDGHRFRPPLPLSDETRALRALVRTRDDLVKQRVALANQLRALLEPLVAQIQHLTAAIEHAIAAHADGSAFMSFPRAGRLNAAQIFVEIGDDRQRFTSAEHLAAEAGVAPVTFESGRHRGVAFRWACNKRLRRALTTFADNSRHESPWAAAVYTRARARGCDHPHAVRILARAWIRVLWRCWQDRTPYNPTNHGALIRMARPA